MSIYGIVKTRDGALATGMETDSISHIRYPKEASATRLYPDFRKALRAAEQLGENCVVVELVPRANIRHEHAHRIIIDPLL